MENTIRELIPVNIKTTLEGITIANDYGNDIASVQRWEQSGNSLKLVPCTIINLAPEDREQRPGLKTSNSLTIMIDLWVIHDKTVYPGSTDSYLNNLLGDIEKSLMADGTRGGIAVNTKIIRVIPFESTQGQPYAGLIIEIKIEYRTNITDPTTAV